MQLDNLKVLEMLSLIYEDLDIDSIEKQFFLLTREVFDFDRLALFFVKHSKGCLQGKLQHGFAQDLIEGMEIPVTEQYLFSTPLITGFPIWNEVAKKDPFVQQLGLKKFALIPIVNKKRIPCWQVNDCREQGCPAYGNKWLRCWQVSETQCASGTSLAPEGKKDKCLDCPIYKDQNYECVEGVLLCDNSLHNGPIKDEAVMMLSIIGHSVGAAIDNSKRFERTMQIAIKDDLTGLHNRRYFNERLLDELERVKRYKDEPLSLIMIDLDHFKSINDSFGHQKGDRVLQWFSRLLAGNLRKSDVIARYGGEEFAILLLNTGKDKALEVAEELREAAEEKSAHELSIERKLTASFGVATFHEDAASYEGFIEKADKALYFAKARGRNRVCAA